MQAPRTALPPSCSDLDPYVASPLRTWFVSDWMTEVRSGDGTYGSRSLQLGGSAVRGACIALVRKAREEAARRLEASVEDIERTADGGFGVRGVPGSSMSWTDLAGEAMLVAEDEFEQDGQTFPF